MGELNFTIKQIPDLSLNKYETLSDSGVKGVLKKHKNFLRQWYGICSVGKISMHFFLVMNKNRMQGEQLEIYLMFRGDITTLRLVEPLIKSSPLSDYFIFEKINDLPIQVYNGATTLIKNECMAEVEHSCREGYKKIYYVPHWEMNNEARMYEAFCMLKTISKCCSDNRGCAYRLDIYPTSEAVKSRKALAPLIHELKGDNDVFLMEKNIGMKKKDGYADTILQDCEAWLTTLETMPHFRVNMYAFADTEFQATVILNAVAAEAIEEGNYGIFPIGKGIGENTFSLKSRLGEIRSYCKFKGNTELIDWSTTFSIDEVEPFFRFPALFEGEVIEIPKETSVLSNSGELYLGKDNNGYEVRYSLKELAKHAFFSGTPGSGKTNTMLHIITELHREKIPFLVLEPAKKEYRALFNRKEMHDIRLYSPHLKSLFPLRLNPFEFPKGVQLSEHISALISVFEGSFVLEGPTYKFLSSSIQTAYEKLGWDIEENNDGTLPFPCLADVYNLLELEIEKSSYDSEIKGNVRSFLQVRLGGLMERDAGELFNVRVSSLSPEQWLYTSAIVELEVLGEQTKNFFVLLLCNYICETLKINPNADLHMPIRHVILLEEAHNIIAQTTQQSGSGDIDPKVSATAYIVKMLAEVRARREAILIADQLPTALASEVTKNTGLKIVHRLTAKDDRDTIGAAISASEYQLEQMLTFTKGQAFAFHERTLKPFAMQVQKWASYDEEYLGLDDEKLSQKIRDTNWYQETIQKVSESYMETIIEPAYKIAKTRYDRGVAYHFIKKQTMKHNATLFDIWQKSPILAEKRVEFIYKKVKRLEKQFGSDEFKECIKKAKEIEELIEKDKENQKNKEVN